ncbi:hypothetical protein NP233_g11208 [Leucocoprinus birnbaumii]|uniref:Peptidase C14 caspase domain-containing protein n=1 Tax=Leucocoprinus birnbaumii TaxID=56174 RepID=A0AAD5VJB2_9AGAR|nr:hypothetical protein NP233_g11208 [Leucocoprinus birnbaumii]
MEPFSVNCLVIGINKYAHYKELQGATQDATNVRRYLIECANVSPDNIIFLVDEEAKRGAIISAFQQLQSVAESDDKANFLVYFAGYGAKSEIPEFWSIACHEPPDCVEAICPADVGDDVPPIPLCTISQFMNWLSTTQGNSALILDCGYTCPTSITRQNGWEARFSPRGLACRFVLPPGCDAEILGRIPQPNDLFLSQCNVWYLCLGASGTGGTAFEDAAKGEGLFTAKLLGTLHEREHQGSLSWSSLVHEMNSTTRQTPECIGGMNACEAFQKFFGAQLENTPESSLSEQMAINWVGPELTASSNNLDWLRSRCEPTWRRLPNLASIVEDTEHADVVFTVEETAVFVDHHFPPVSQYTGSRLLMTTKGIGGRSVPDILNSVVHFRRIFKLSGIYGSDPNIQLQMHELEYGENSLRASGDNILAEPVHGGPDIVVMRRSNPPPSYGFRITNTTDKLLHFHIYILDPATLKITQWYSSSEMGSHDGRERALLPHSSMTLGYHIYDGGFMHPLELPRHLESEKNVVFIKMLLTDRSRSLRRKVATPTHCRGTGSGGKGPTRLSILPDEVWAASNWTLLQLYSTRFGAINVG